MSCFKRSIPWNGWNIPGVFGGRFRRRFRKLGENKIFHRTVVKQILDGVCFVLHVFCCSKNDIEVNYIVMIIPCFTGGWTDTILTRWWDLYDSLGAFFQIKCRFEARYSSAVDSRSWWWQLKYFFIFSPKIGEMIQFDEHIFQMGWNHHLEIFCSFAYLLPKLRVSPSDGWEDELPKFQCGFGKFVSSF